MMGSYKRFLVDSPLKAMNAGIKWEESTERVFIIYFYLQSSNSNLKSSESNYKLLNDIILKFFKGSV